ncbi:MAG: hypothetical protein R2860_07720 [Desulfobacterales bacterium]
MGLFNKMLFGAHGGLRNSKLEKMSFGTDFQNFCRIWPGMKKPGVCEYRTTPLVLWECTRPWCTRTRLHLTGCAGCFAASIPDKKRTQFIMYADPHVTPTA